MRRQNAIYDALRIALSAGALTLLTATFASAQLAVPPAPGVDAAADAVNTADQAAQDATNTAQDAVQDATNTAEGAVQDATGTAQQATQDATGTAQDAVRSGTNTAQDAVRGATDTAREATEGATDTAREATGAARRTGQRAAQDAASTTRRAQTATEGAAQTRAQTRTQTQAGIRANAQGSQTTAAAQLRSADMGVWFDRSTRDGLVIADVATDAALAQFGFVEGDRIVSVLGQPVRTESDFVRYLTSNRAADRLQVVVMRDGREEVILIDPVVLNERMTTVVAYDPMQQFGVIIDDRRDDQIVVWRVIPRSPAFYAGLRAGDVITMFAGQPVSNLDQFSALLAETDPGLIPIRVARNGRTRNLEAEFPEFEVAERQTTYRQDLDVDTTIRSDANIRANPDIRTDVRTDIDAGVRREAGRISGQADLEGEVDARASTPDSGYSPAPRSSRDQGSYSRPARRGIFRRR